MRSARWAWLFHSSRGRMPVAVAVLIARPLFPIVFGDLADDAQVLAELGGNMACMSATGAMPLAWHELHGGPVEICWIKGARRLPTDWVR